MRGTGRRDARSRGIGRGTGISQLDHHARRPCFAVADRGSAGRTGRGRSGGLAPDRCRNPRPSLGEDGPASGRGAYPLPPLWRRRSYGDGPIPCAPASRGKRASCCCRRNKGVCPAVGTQASGVRLSDRNLSFATVYLRVRQGDPIGHPDAPHSPGSRPRSA
jgi:hypothetical protein